MTYPVLNPNGVITRIRYRFALWPQMTDDIGIVLFDTYQVLDIERDGKVNRFVLGDPINWYTRSWSRPTALRGDGREFMVHAR